MSDRIAPPTELVESSLPDLVSNVALPHLVPEGHAKSIEVGSDVSRIRIALIELPPEDELRSKRGLQGSWSDRSNQAIDGF